MIDLLSSAVAAVVVLVAGGFPRRVTAADVVGPAAGSFLAGAVALHLGLTLSDRLGIAWNRPTILVVALLAAALWWVLGGPLRGDRLDRRAPGWGLLVGSLPVAVFAGLAAVHLAHTPDFVFHWGTKAARWVAERGVDVALFAGDSSWRLNPGYPQLVPELMALPGLLFGGYVERAALLVGPAVAMASLLAWRYAARAAGAAGFELEVGTALTGAALGGFGFVHGAAGGADGVVAFALLAGVAALVLRDRPGALPALALAAALAAAAKTEGLTVAVLLLAVDATVTLGREGSRSAASRLLRTAPAGMAVVALWWNLEGRLYLPNRASWPDLDRLGQVAEAIAESAMRPEAGFQWIFLLALPWCFTRRDLRAPAVVIAAQAVTFLVAFVAEPVDSGFLVVSTMPRLVSQLVPAVLLLTVLRSAEASLGLRGVAGGKISS